MSKLQGKTKIGLIIGIIFILGFFSALYYFSYQEFSKETEVKLLLAFIPQERGLVPSSYGHNPLVKGIEDKTDNTDLGVLLLSHTGHDYSNPLIHTVNWQWTYVKDPDSPTGFVTKYEFAAYKEKEQPTPKSEYKILDALKYCVTTGFPYCDYTQTEYWDGTRWEPINANTKYSAFVIAVNNSGELRLQSETVIVASSIEAPTRIDFNTVKTDVIRLSAANNEDLGQFTGIGQNPVGNSAIMIERKEPSQIFDWSRNCGFDYCDKSDYIEIPLVGKYTVFTFDIRLLINQRYCYRAKARNQDGLSTDETDWSIKDGKEWDNPYKYHPQDCRCTWTNVPKAPFIKQLSDTQLNIRINSDDGNPHGEAGRENTEYAICAERYNSDGALEWSKYVDAGGSVDSLNGPDCSGDVPSGFWQTRSGWGGDDGFNISIDSMGKYSFALKSRNCDGIVTGFGESARFF